MRDNDLAKNLGKTNKEVTDTLQKNNMEENSSMTNGAGTQPAGENKEGAAPAKKRIAAVYRPQNSTQKGRGGRSQGQGARNQRSTGPGMQVRPTTSAPAQKPKAAPAEEVKEQTTAPVQETETAPVQAASQAEARPQGSRQGGYNRDGQRDGNRQGGYNRDGQRDGNRQGGYNRDGQRDGNRQGGFNRDGQRDGNRQGGFNRDGQRDGNRQGGFNRDGQRDGNRQGGYNRDGGRQGGYGRDGQRDGNRQGGYGRDGQRDGNRQGGRDGRGGLNIPKPSFDTPMAQKQQNTKASKNAYKKEHDARKDRDEELRGKNAKGGKGVKAPVMQQPKKAEAKVEEIKTIVIPETITIKELAEKMKLQPSAIVKKLFLQGTIVTINQEIDFEKAEEIAMEYDVLCEKEKKINVIEELLREEEEDEKDMVSRPPVICVMGHVDHGKTSLLDAIRQSNVTSREAGGITQHIGAYVVEANGQRITFLDTPGHEAFTAMRMRGAQATDIAILVVAADDGVMPQTVEAINHAKAAGVEIIVAVNKIDKPGANPDRVRQELTEYGVIPEEWGGQNMFVNISAKQKIGIDDLLETVLLQADVLELKANPDTFASGNVLEAKLDKGRGSVATVLVTRGTLHVGDTLVAGLTYGRVRAMLDPKGRAVTEAGPSDAVEILGLQSVPNAGDEFRVFEDEREARALADERSLKARIEEQSRVKHVTLENLFETIADAEVKELNLIIKADVQGSIEALQDSLDKMDQSEVRINTIHSAVGAINETDVVLADASNAIIIGFGVRPDGKARSAAEREGVEIRCYDVIYKCLEELDAARIGMLKPTEVEVSTGTATVLDTFKVPKVGIAAGVRVEEGEIAATDSVRLVRDGIVVFNGKIASMRHYKDEAKSLKSGSEGGIGLENFQDIKPGDQIEGYRIDQVARTE